MLHTLFTIGLMGLASASPINSCQAPKALPATSSSKGFQLVVNVTDLSRDFTPSIHHTFIQGVHEGAGLDTVIPGGNAKTGRVLYVNGTSGDISAGRGSVLSGTTEFFQGLKFDLEQGSKTLSYVSLMTGSGDKGVGISTSASDYAHLESGQFVACTRQLAYGGPQVVIMRSNAASSTVPSGCAPVRLIPQCANVGALPAASDPAHRHIAESRCYKDALKVL